MSQTQRNTFVNMREMCPAAFCSPSLGQRYRHVGLGMETFSIPPSLSQLSIKEHHRCLWFLQKHPAQEYHPTFPDLVPSISDICHFVDTKSRSFDTKKTQNFRFLHQNTPIYNILTPDWNFGHLHRMWCM